MPHERGGRDSRTEGRRRCARFDGLGFSRRVNEACRRLWPPRASVPSGCIRIVTAGIPQRVAALPHAPHSHAGAGGLRRPAHPRHVQAPRRRRRACRRQPLVEVRSNAPGLPPPAEPVSYARLPSARLRQVPPHSERGEQRVTGDESGRRGSEGVRAGAARCGPLRSGSDGTRTRGLRRDRARLSSAKPLQTRELGAAAVTFPSPFYGPQPAAASRTRRKPD
jgi:hypothetical protein